MRYNKIMNISIMMKPASSNCNLRCKYCFYNDLSSHREMPSRGIMSQDTLRNILKKAFDFAGDDKVMLSFQGGEPLIAGKEFFKNVHAIIRELNVRKCPVYIGIQTNGTLIDDEWCQIFKRGGYLVGLSLDGDEIADLLRIDANGEPTFQRVLSAAKLMQKYGVEFNILTVLTKQVAQRIDRIYAFFKKQGFRHLQFIPMLKPLRLDENGKPISACEYSTPFPSEEENYVMSGEDYAYFLKKCFSLYLKDFVDGKYTSIRQFDNFVRLAHHEIPEQCGMDGHCCHQFVIEGDGEVYPCDFYCVDCYDMGNINDTDFFALSKHPIATQFIKESMQIDEKCKACKYYALCKNGCKRERIDIDKCDAYKQFFAYALPHLQRMS